MAPQVATVKTKVSSSNISQWTCRARAQAPGPSVARDGCCARKPRPVASFGLSWQEKGVGSVLGWLGPAGPGSFWSPCSLPI